MLHFTYLEVSPSSFIHLHLHLECDAGLLSPTYGSALCCHDDEDYHHICSLITSFALTWDYLMSRVLRRLYELQYLRYEFLSSRALTSSPSDDTFVHHYFQLLQYQIITTDRSKHHFLGLI